MDAQSSLSKQEAVAQGYGVLTSPYSLPEEQPMLDNVIADMRRGGIDFVLVQNTGTRGRSSLEVWRKGLVKS